MSIHIHKGLFFSSVTFLNAVNFSNVFLRTQNEGRPYMLYIETEPQDTYSNYVTLSLFVEDGIIEVDGKSCNGAFGFAVMCVGFKTEMVRTEVFIL
jgi:hypothetical protein